MSALVVPIHTEALGLANVRFFAPPSGGREFPWLSVDDLFSAVVMDRRMRRAFRADIESSPWAGSVRQITTPDGRMLICKHFVAQGLIDAWTQVGRCSADFYGAYTKGGVAALSKLTGELGPDQLMAYLRDATVADGGRHV